MKVAVKEPFRVKGINLEPGKIIEIPETIYPRLKDKVEPLPGEVWLEGDELRTRGNVNNLESEICRLTKNNLKIQKALLLKHCESYDQHHFFNLRELWEERAGIMEFDGRLPRHEAEQKAAELLHLIAFMEELKSGRV